MATLYSRLERVTTFETEHERAVRGMGCGSWRAKSKTDKDAGSANMRAYWRD